MCAPSANLNIDGAVVDPLLPTIIAFASPRFLMVGMVLRCLNWLYPERCIAQAPECRMRCLAHPGVESRCSGCESSASQGWGMPSAASSMPVGMEDCLLSSQSGAFPEIGAASRVDADSTISTAVLSEMF